MANAGRIMMIPKGNYSATTTYSILDIVSYNGSSYIAKQTTVGNVPTDTTYWQPLADMTGKMDRSVYDSNNSGVVDNAEKVNNHTVAKDVPADAKFTDTKTLSGMTDVVVNNPTEGQTLRYNSTSEKFENSTVASTFNDLTDTNFTNLSDGQVPMYDYDSGKWINTDIEGVVPIVTWANGTDAQIAAMLEAHYNGEIDIHDYWSVGDERVVHLNAMEATGVGESHVAQDVTFVLMNEGGKTLTTSINSVTECAFIVGQKNILANGSTPEAGYMNSTDVNAGGWDSSARRTWCNSVYKNALPATLVSIFKQHQNITSQGSTGQNDTTTSNDYFALPSEKEVLGTTSWSSSTAETSNSQFEYYETSANRIKKAGDVGNVTYKWWERSPRTGNSADFCNIQNNGNDYSTDASSACGIAPFGVI